MKIQISFTYNAKCFKYTISDKFVDMTHYDNLWDYWFSENDNEIAYPLMDEENEKVFEVTAHKVFTKDDLIPLISGRGLYINVYKNTFEDDYCDQILGDIEVLYA